MGEPKKATTRTTWRLLEPHARPIMPLLVLTAVLSALTSAMQAGFTLLLPPVFNLVLFPGGVVEAPAGSEAAADAVPGGAAGAVVGEQLMERSSLVEWFASTSAWLDGALGLGWDPRYASLALVLIVLFGMTLAAAASVYGFNQLTNLVALRMVVGLRVRVAEHLMNLSLHYHGQRKLGDLLSRISADIQATLNAVNIWFKDFLRNGFTAIFYLAVAAYCAPLLTLLMVLTIPLLAVPVARLAKKVRKRSTKSYSSLGASVQVLTQMFVGVRTVKAFRAEKSELERYRDLNERYLTDYMRLVRTMSLTQAWSITYTHIGLGILLLFVGVGSVEWGLFTDFGAMTAFFLANAQAYTAIKRLTRAVTNVEVAVGASQRLEELLDEEPGVVDAQGATELDVFRESIRFEHVDFAYPDGDGTALDDIDLEVRAGETLAIVGASGSGKSTLMSLVARFFDPTSGRILVDGHDLGSVTLDSWSANWSLVDQSPFLFHTSIEENLRYGKPDATREEIEAACRAAQIHDFVQTLPDGYATNVEDAGARLSGGQRQRITIARALLKGAPLLLLDEATSALDTESERGVQEALEVLMEGRTVIVIAHRLSTIRNADRIAVLDGGRLVELGTHDELWAKGGAYARALELQELVPRGE